MPTRIILDCDPGHDDAVAMLLAHGSLEIDLLAVTTVGGNQTLDKVTRNALAVASVIGITGVPFAAGCDRPLVRPLKIAPDVHGDSGLDGVELPEPTFELDPRHGVDLLIDTVMDHEPGTVTLVATGPLTNIAMAVRKEPKMVDRVKEVVVMGGGVHVGNWSPVAEFNIVVDPEAADVVFGAGWKLTMVGLDLTHQALATDEVVERIRAVGGPVSDFFLGLFAFFRQAYQEAQGFDFPAIHDPCAVAYVIDPTVMTTRRAPVKVELTGTHTLGMTVADLRRDAPEDCPTQVAVDLDFDKFWTLVLEALVRVTQQQHRS